MTTYENIISKSYDIQHFATSSVQLEAAWAAAAECRQSIDERAEPHSSIATLPDISDGQLLQECGELLLNTE